TGAAARGRCAAPGRPCPRGCRPRTAAGPSATRTERPRGRKRPRAARRPVPAGRLFRGHVAGGAHNGAALGRGNVRVQLLGQTEVGDLRKEEGGRRKEEGRVRWIFFILHPSDFCLLEEDVRRLQIAVNDAVLVGVVDGAGQGFQQGGGGGRRLGRSLG